MLAARTGVVIVEVIAAVFVLNTLAIAFMVFRERRNPQSIMIWSLAFYAVPIISFIFYVFIGRGPRLSKKKKLLSKVLEDEKYYEILEESYSYFESFTGWLSNDTADFIKFCTSYNKSPCCVYNDVEIYTDIQLQYDKMLEDISNAKHTVNLMYFIYKDSEIGRLFRGKVMSR